MNPPADHLLSQLQKVVRAEMPTPRPGLPLPVLPDRGERLLSVLESLEGWVSEFDGKGRLLYASPNIQSVLGFTPEECMDSQALEFHPDDLPRVIEIGRKVRLTGEPSTNQTRIRHKQGHWVWLETSLLGWYGETGEFHTIAFTRDISELKEAEAARSESETRYRVVSQMSCDLFVEVDGTGRTIYLGPGAEEVVGRSVKELMESEPMAFVHPDDKPLIQQQLAEEFGDSASGGGGDRKGQPMEYRFQHRDGRWLWFETLGQTYQRADGETRFLAVTRNVTERKLAEQARHDLEESLQRAQKLESLGVLAGGIAHDFNNLLTPILAAAGLGLEELPEDSPSRARFEKIARAAQRAAALTNQMLAYAGQHSLRVERLDLSTLVGDMQELVTGSLAGKAVVGLELAPNLPPIEGEAAQISQVVMNLVSNAAESLPDGTSRISVRTGLVLLDAPPPGALFSETMTPGEHVYFEVADDGCGMDTDTQARIFDPFYTTKFTGRGLGLAAVAGIVRAHRGAIQLESAPEKGTRFRVLLPAAEGAVGEAPPRTAIEAWRTTATALVIDDDDAVREIAAEVLSRAGMEVLTAADGKEGVALFELHADRIQIVLLDRTMPTMSGAEAFQAIRSRNPQAKIVLVSGYSEERAASELLGRGLAGFLKKPFSPEALLERVREALESADRE